MADNLSKMDRSKQMSLVKSKNTKPEMFVRKLVHAMGYRYRLHDKKLPGKPDMVFKSRNRVIFVHGCFWHRHENCKLARLPKSRLDFWEPKLEANKERDKLVQKQLTEFGWQFLIIWECQLNDVIALRKRIVKFLDGSTEGGE